MSDLKRYICKKCGCVFASYFTDRSQEQIGPPIEKDYQCPGCGTVDGPVLTAGIFSKGVYWNKSEVVKKSK